MALALLLASSLALAADFQGVWDASILASAQHVPFRMEISGSPARVCFFEDTQPVCSTAARIEGASLTAEWDYMNTELTLSLKDGTLSGVYRNRRTKKELAVEAMPHKPPEKAAEPPAKLAGEWEVHSTEEPKLAWQLFLRQSGKELKGTILRVDGDDGTLAGQVSGNQFSISHFSGDRPTLLAGTRLADGSLNLQLGDMKLYALRPAVARARNLPPPDDPATFAKAKNPAEPFRFSLPDLNGRIVTEADFAGKPLIVSIAGSWCPNCRDEAPFFVDLYRQYHAQGLEIVAFFFEPDGDPTYAPLRAMLRKYGITYTALLAGDSTKLKEIVPQIENIAAFPTSIYIGKDGRVRSVHTGFPSAGSGEELTRVKNELRALVERMIAEEPRP
jgi:thiol-disulfide isomerase/thioredoxin